MRAARHGICKSPPQNIGHLCQEGMTSANKNITFSTPQRQAIRKYKMEGHPESADRYNDDPNWHLPSSPALLSALQTLLRSRLYRLYADNVCYHHVLAETTTCLSAIVRSQYTSPGAVRGPQFFTRKDGLIHTCPCFYNESGKENPYQRLLFIPRTDAILGSAAGPCFIAEGISERAVARFPRYDTHSNYQHQTTLKLKDRYGKEQIRNGAQT
jgi:hypothetical protein